MHACNAVVLAASRREREKEFILEAKSKSMDSLSLSQWSFAFCLSN
jgi:hypothetical protein